MQNYNKYAYKIPANRLFPQRQLIYMPECHSTNAYLEQLVKEGTVAEGSVLITDYQYAGRGQRGNTWLSEPGKNLTFSVFLRPTFLPASAQMYLTRTFALGITDWLLQKTRAQVHIKWPNDILLNQKKICGILIENQLQHHHITASIVGIGLNVNQVNFPFSTATSLQRETGTEAYLPTCLHELMEYLDRRYDMLVAGNWALLHSDYLTRMFALGKEVIIGDDPHRFPGVVLGVDDQGRLEVRTPWGIRFLAFKEMAIQWPFM
jgi:BirA family biotin operon repressor/biotin-[acetyl-CoA-carboxylase] ligase